jgi:small subunit ribosomal protein S5
MSEEIKKTTRTTNSANPRPAGTGYGANNRGDRNPSNSRGGKFPNRNNIKNNKNNRRGRDRRKTEEPENKYDSQIIQVRRVTRVVKGGKRMRFSALVVVGDKKGKVGYGLKKGVDFQESVAKATKQATANLVDLKLNENGSIPFMTSIKYKSSMIMLKPADEGTGLISGGFVRPVLELAGVQNVYSKILGSSNKVTGVQAVFEALKKYS